MKRIKILLVIFAGIIIGFSGLIYAKQYNEKNNSVRNMSVVDAVVVSLWESRNAGYVNEDNICDPGFEGDVNYYGWAW